MRSFLLAFLLVIIVASTPLPLNVSDFPFIYHSYKVGTWNVMMQPWFVAEENWADHALARLLDTKFDILALQEVWEPASKDRILALPGLKKAYPHHYYVPLPDSIPKIGCDFANNNLLLQYSYGFIATAQAYQVNTQQLQQPLAGPLPMDVGMIAVGIGMQTGGQQCLQCLFNELEYLPQGEAAFLALDTCGKYQGAKWTHKGSNGQLILSKWPIQNVKLTSFDSFLANRINIHATIKGVKFGFGHWPFNVLEDMDPSLAPLMEGALQPQVAQDFIDFGDDVVVGDFNSGPNYQPAGYDLLVAAGYKGGFKSTTDTWCTTAHSSFKPCLTSGVPPGTPDAIDHIMLKDSKNMWLKSTFLFNDLPSDMSDHTGVGAEIRKCWWSDDLKKAIEKAKKLNH